LIDLAKTFLGQIVAILPSLVGMKRQLDRETGRRFSAFNLFNTNEDATSRVLAFLFDPKEAHGQGDVFLRLFIERFVPEWTGAFRYDQAKPASTAQKIDATLSDGTHWLGIENKIFDAHEQKDQVDRYLRALKSKARSDNYRLVYLSPKGTPPTNLSFTDAGQTEHADKFVNGAWVHSVASENEKIVISNILDWIADCHKECQAENIRWFLKQFSVYVRSVITAERELDMTDAVIVNLALNNEHNLQGALLIAENGDGIRNRVIGNLLCDIEASLLQLVQQRGSDWELVVEWKMGRWSKKPADKWLPILLRRKRWPAMVGASVQAELNGPDGVIVGIIAPTEAGWKGDSGAVPYYGNQHDFIGDEARLAVAKAVELEKPAGRFWISYKRLNDTEGRDISSWRDTDTVMRLYKEKGAVCEGIVTKIRQLADATDKHL
jgi:PD-(D/E)XK nuclease superfamily